MTQTPREKIRELRALLDEGLLTEQEFSQRKNAILDSEFSPVPAPVYIHATAMRCDTTQSTDLGLLVGQEIGTPSRRYRLEKLLGQGGMGQVWLATDLATHAELGHSDMVALKILPPQLTQNAMHARLLIEEASLVRKLAHENIVRVYDWALDPATGSHFIIMEYLEGQDLDSYLSRHGPCTFEQVHTLLKPVAEALQYAWEKHRLVHRDLKPSNLFLTRQGDIKLLDFGISARMRSATSNGTTNSLIMPPNSPSNAGTAGYRAPEAGTHQRLFNPSLDVYAVAIMMYQMLEGALPFSDHRDHRYHARQPVRPSALNLGQWQVLQSGFAIQAEQRPATAQALIDAMQCAASQQPKVERFVDDAAQLKFEQEHRRRALEEQQRLQSEAAVRHRAEQRQQRKQLEEQQRKKAAAALRALIKRQNRIREIEEEERLQLDADVQMLVEQHRMRKEMDQQERLEADSRYFAASKAA